ncbi:MAG: hypothetical protein AAGH89_01540 [Verrucomicrobiota bacterium]
MTPNPVGIAHQQPGVGAVQRSLPQGTRTELAINHNVVAESRDDRTIPQSLQDWHFLANRNPGKPPFHSSNLGLNVHNPVGIGFWPLRRGLEAA